MKKIYLIPFIVFSLVSCGGNPSAESISKGSEDTSKDSSTLTTSVTSETTSEGTSNTSETLSEVHLLDVIYSYKATELLDLDKTKDYKPGEEVSLDVTFYNDTYIKYTRLQVNELFYTFTAKEEGSKVGTTTFKVPNKDFVLALTYFTLGREEKSSYKVEFEPNNDYLILGLTSGESYSTDMRFDVYVYDSAKRVNQVFECYEANGYHENEIEYGYWCVSYPLKEVTRDISLKVTLTDNKPEVSIEYSLEWSYIQDISEFLDVENSVMPTSVKQGDQALFSLKLKDGFGLYWYFNDRSMDSFAEKNEGDIEGSKVPEYCEATSFIVKMPKWTVSIYLTPYEL